MFGGDQVISKERILRGRRNDMGVLILRGRRNDMGGVLIYL
jgi:hypothetical protein